MYVVYASHVAQSIPLELDDAIEFARESNMDCEIRDVETYELVWSSAEDESSRFYVEIECDMPVWGKDSTVPL